MYISSTMSDRQIYKFQSYFHFNDCDPAGIFYFGNVTNLCHRVYEDWLLNLNPTWSFWFNNSEWIIPIRNSTVDYLGPMKAGDPFTIELSLSKLSESSFTSHFNATHPQTQQVYFTAEIVHVFVKKATFKKEPIPPSVRPLFESYLISRSL